MKTNSTYIFIIILLFAIGIYERFTWKITADEITPAVMFCGRNKSLIRVSFNAFKSKGAKYTAHCIDGKYIRY